MFFQNDHDVFIIYNTENEDYIKKFTDALREVDDDLNIKLIHTENIDLGERIIDQCEQNVMNSKMCVCFIGKSFTRDSIQDRERQKAEEIGIPIIYVACPDVDNLDQFSGLIGIKKFIFNCKSLDSNKLSFHKDVIRVYKGIARTIKKISKEKNQQEIERNQKESNEKDILLKKALTNYFYLILTMIAIVVIFVIVIALIHSDKILIENKNIEISNLKKLNANQHDTIDLHDNTICFLQKENERKKKDKESLELQMLTKEKEIKSLKNEKGKEKQKNKVLVTDNINLKKKLLN